MSDPYVGEIRMFAGTFAPQGWALCEGQLLAVSQNDALFSLLGTIYGGDGRTTFGLPDLRGRLPIHQGSGPGLTSRNLGSRSGAETVVPTANQLPVHTHALMASAAPGSDSNPAGGVPAESVSVDLYIEEATTVSLNANALTSVGSSQSHTNLQPALCVRFIIALFGVYPSRT
jgi:microcystin-dependent protein